MSVERDMASAHRDGAHAARSGKRITSNPHDTKSRKASVRVLGMMWVTGYGTGNPVSEPVEDESPGSPDESDVMKASIVHVHAHTRAGAHGLEDIAAYDYDRDTGRQILPTPTPRKVSSSVGVPSSSGSAVVAGVVHSDPHSPGGGVVHSGQVAPVVVPRVGMHVATPDDHARLATDGIKLPPAWTNVHISDDPKAALVAIGQDSKGRSQYVYSAEHSEKQAAAKFSRINTLRSHIADVDHSLAKDAPTSDSAAALMMIRRLGLRPGSDTDTGAEKKAYGATNLRVEHVKLDGDTVNLNFTGKKGVALSFSVKDAQLAETLAPRLEGKQGGDKVFDTNEKKTADYFHSVVPGFKLKDLRTYHGTLHAFALVDGMPVPSSKAELAKARRDVATQVSARLGNTPTVALASYIDPAVFAKWEGVGK